MVRARRIKLRRALAERHLAQADTLGDLARAIGIPPPVLTQTVARLNGFATTGVDEDFDKGGGTYRHTSGLSNTGPIRASVLSSNCHSTLSPSFPATSARAAASDQRVRAAAAGG